MRYRRFSRARLCWLLLGTHTSLIEMHSALTALLWGGWLLNPTWQTFSTTPTFRTLIYLWPSETALGLVVFGGGALQLAAVLVNRLTLRRFTALFATLMWLFLTTAFAHANIGSTAVPVYGVITLFSGLTYLRLAILDTPP